MYIPNYVFFFCRCNVLQAFEYSLTLRVLTDWITLVSPAKLTLKAGRRSCGSGTVRGNRALRASSAELARLLAPTHAGIKINSTIWQPRPNFSFAKENVCRYDCIYHLDGQGIWARFLARDVFSSPKRPARLWGPSSLLHSGYRGIIPQG
jgi:hypothetical protein